MRPISDTDLRTLAAYLAGTDDDVEVALSEMGFDPWAYPEICEWLAGLGLILNGTWQWEIDR
jgi:hypothetical protein